MNFIAKWCHDRCGMNCECGECKAECLPRVRLSEETGVSEHLLWILQNQSGGITHPEIADCIADYIGATAEERDSIVHKGHHGTYAPNPSNPAFICRVHRKPGVRTSRFVVAIDVAGDVVMQFSSMEEAARRMGCSVRTVYSRCNRVSSGKSEFELLGVSFRFMNEWAGMTDKERKMDIVSVRNRAAAK